MSSVARALRRETLGAMRARTAEERIVLALRLGDSDVALFGSAARVGEEDARRRLVLQRAASRRPSACASGR
jgi:hypothetical protein